MKYCLLALFALVNASYACTYSFDLYTLHSSLSLRDELPKIGPMVRILKIIINRCTTRTAIVKQQEWSQEKQTTVIILRQQAEHSFVLARCFNGVA